MKMIPLVTGCLEKLLSSSLPLGKLLKRYYHPIVKKEVALGKITSTDRVLCIGGGAIPWTAIEIASQSGASVHVIDCDPKAVQLANRFLKLVNLEHKVHCRFGDGQRENVRNYSVIHVALQAFPQEKIISHLLTNGTDNLRILVRCPKKGISCLYGATCSNANCLINCSTSQPFSTMQATVMYIKTKGRGEKNEERVVTADRKRIHYPVAAES
ncbi:MAG: hypothetical protein LRY73_18015 [Bacillus sp. (in: Bacteria)]|nr:hypothetical protein [Bacillus sp. (in: firmicutes)]